MRIRPLCALSVLCLAACATPPPAPEDLPMPHAWIETNMTLTEPVRAYYLGNVDILGYGDFSTTLPQDGIYSVWGKLVYQAPQPSDAGAYLTDAYNLKIDCLIRSVGIFREVRFNADGDTVSDVKDPPGSQGFDPRYTGDLAALSPEQALAVKAFQYICRPDPQEPQ